MDLKISIRTQLYVLRELIVISIIYFGIMSFLYLYNDFGLFKIIFLSTFVFYLIVFLLPVVILHINYLKNQYKTVKIDEKKLIINDTIYQENDIYKIIIYATAQHFNNSIGVTALPYNDYYYYVEVYLKSGESINLSSLIEYKIDKLIKENFKAIEIVEKPSSFTHLLIK